MLLAAISTTGAIASETKNIDPKVVTIGGPIKATLLNGYVNGMDPITMVFSDENNCKYLGNATYIMAPERVSVDVYKRSCIIDGQVIETDLRGFVTDELRYGISAKVDYSNDKIAATVYAGKNLEIFISKVNSSTITDISTLANAQTKEPLNKNNIKEKLEKQYIKNGCNSLTKTKSETENAYAEKLKNCLIISFMQSLDETMDLSDVSNSSPIKTNEKQK